VDFSKEKVTKFNPHAPQHRRKLWARVPTAHGSYHHVYWRRIAVAAVALAIVGWLGLATAAWVFVKYRRGYEGVSYIDVAFYPLRREQYRTSIGRYFIAAGRTALENQNIREGYAFLQAGLGRLPQDVEARKLLAVLEARIGRPDRAVKTLVAGVEFSRHDFEYLKLLFTFLLETQEDERAIALATELLPPQPDAVLLNQYVALQSATAHYHRGRTGQVERLVADWGLHRAIEGQILLARCEWQNGLHDAAISRLESRVATFPKSDDLFLELVRFNRELGRNDDARRYALLRQFNDPVGPGPRIDLLHTYRNSGDTTAEQRELKEYLHRFAADDKAMLLLAWFALDTAQPALMDQVYNLASEKKFYLAPFDLARVGTHLAAKDHARARELADAALKTIEPGNARNITLLNGLRAVALFGLGDTSRGQVVLTAFLEESRVRATDALLLARNLKGLGYIPQARRVLERACDLDPQNQPVLAELIRIDAETGDRAALAENLPKLFGMRKHSRATLEKTLQSLNEPSDAPLREQIRAALAKPAAH
jgi:tetratricopeptide (TPR) repeat protein